MDLSHLRPNVQWGAVRGTHTHTHTEADGFDEFLELTRSFETSGQHRTIFGKDQSSV